MLNETAFVDKGNGLRVAMSGGIADTTLMAVASAFRNSVTRKYRMLSAKHIAQTFGDEPEVLPSIKYDGEGVFVYFDAEKELCVALNAPSGKARVGLPCTEEAKRILLGRGHTRALLCAELYLKTPAGQRSRVSDVIHATSNGTPEERQRLALAFYDAVMLDGKDLRDNQRTFTATHDLLGDLFGTDPSLPCHRTEGSPMPGSQVAGWFHGITTEHGLEGIVVRLPRNETTYKIKPNLTVDTVAIGYVEGDFEDRYGVLSILCAVTGPDRTTLQALCRVGSGLTDSQREELLEVLASRKLGEPPINMTDSSGRPITFIRPEIVIEVEGEALVEDSLDGSPVTNQGFTWDGEGLHFLGLSPSPRLAHAVFGSVRTDKTWDDGGTRMSQVMSETTIARILTPRSLENASPAIFLREVYAKTSKSGDPAETAVRKIVVVQREDQRFARFTLHWTDFSSARETPLKTETRIAETPERLIPLLAGYRAEGKKRGWALVSETHAAQG